MADRERENENRGKNPENHEEPRRSNELPKDHQPIFGHRSVEGPPPPKRPPHAGQGRNIQTTENDSSGVFETIATYLSIIIMVITFPISIFMCLIVLAEYQRVVIFRLGRLRKGGARGPGLCFILPCIDRYIKVDLRTASFDVPPQEILTKDSVSIKVDAVVYYSIKNPLDAVIQIADCRQSTRLLAQTTLRNVVGSKTLTDLLTAKEMLSRQIGEILDVATDPWGVNVERVEIKEIYMPPQLQRAMAVEQEAMRDAMAKVAAAEGERNSAKMLKEAADVMIENPIALQLRYLQTLNSISNKDTKSFVFPFPIDLIKKLVS